jgi:1-acyl-sn-glycerol-3-phosphate acyltransferase
LNIETQQNAASAISFRGEAGRRADGYGTQSEFLLRTLLRNPGRIFFRGGWLLAEFVRAAAEYTLQLWFRGSVSRRRAQALWLQRACCRVLRALNVKSQVFGSVAEKGLLASNHLSYLDILVLGAMAPTVFVAKCEVRSWPLFGWFARMAGTIFVRRDRRRDTVRVNSEIVRALEEKVLVVLFPEGTSSDGQTVLPFKSPLLASVTSKPHPVWAGFIDYALQEGSVSEEVCYWRDMTLAPHLLNLLGKPAIAARVAVAPCHCASEGGRERKELAHRLRHSVLSLKEAFGFLKSYPEDRQARSLPQ